MHACIHTYIHGHMLYILYMNAYISIPAVVLLHLSGGFGDGGDRRGTRGRVRSGVLPGHLHRWHRNRYVCMYVFVYVCVYSDYRFSAVRMPCHVCVFVCTYICICMYCMYVCRWYKAECEHDGR